MWSNCVLCWWEERERDEYRLGTECRMSAKGFVLKEVCVCVSVCVSLQGSKGSLYCKHHQPHDALLS